MRIDGHRIYIRKFANEDADALLQLRRTNRTFLQPFEPTMTDAHYTINAQTELVQKMLRNWDDELGYAFGIFHVDTEQLIGRITLSNVVRGAWESCTLGYFMDEKHNGLGYMTEAVRLAIGFAFHSARLHRVQAAVMPRNTPSIRVLEKVGFRYEGFAEYYLQINGQWAHHNIYSVTQEYWK